MRSLALTEEERALARTAREAVRRGEPWPALARLLLDEGQGIAAVGVVAEELGRAPAATPLLTVVLGGAALALGEDGSWRRELLPGIFAGEVGIALAQDEGTRHARGAAAAVRGGQITGEKTMVLGADTAAWLVATAREGLFLVRRDAPGVAVTRLALVDGRDAARVRLAEAPVVARLGGAALLDAVLDRGQAVLAAEMLGGACAVFEATLAHLKTRRQFGVPIGSFQALKHRAARLHIELELLRSVVRAALCALEDGERDAPALSAAAKARASDVYLAVAAEAIQLHGGMGVTDELDVGRHYKRAKVAEALLGTGAFHRRRLAGA
jgi:alkylation response protein AidB-like acyl-CoA dehydrogenase